MADLIRISDIHGARQRAEALEAVNLRARTRASVAGFADPFSKDILTQAEADAFDRKRAGAADSAGSSLWSRAVRGSRRGVCGAIGAAGGCIAAAIALAYPDAVMMLPPSLLGALAGGVVQGLSTYGRKQEAFLDDRIDDREVVTHTLTDAGGAALAAGLGTIIGSGADHLLLSVDASDQAAAALGTVTGMAAGYCAQRAIQMFFPPQAPGMEANGRALA